MRTGRYWLMVLLLAGTAVGYHALPHGRYVPPRRSLSTFPNQVGDYLGQDVGISDNVRSFLGEGEFLQRVYRRTTVDLPVLWYVGYYPHQETGGTVHSPQHCLPGGGWEPLDIGRMQIALNDGRTIEVNRYVVQKGKDRLLVLYWFQGRGRIVASEYWGKFYLVRDAILTNRTDGAVVRVSTPFRKSTPQTERALRSFVSQIVDVLGTFIPD